VPLELYDCVVWYPGKYGRRYCNLASLPEEMRHAPLAPCSRIGLVLMSTSGHDVVMKQVRIADLKSRLSEHLRAVRRGEIITVLDRNTPVARISPIRDRALEIRKPAPGTPRPGRVRLPGRRLKLEVDVVDLLLEERQGPR
jgi:prevent-host-death family protein